MKKRNDTPLQVLKCFYLDKFQPQLYTEALSQLELLYSILKHVDLVIDRVNSFQDLINEIIVYITEFDKKVTEATKEVLTELYESGQLKEILEEVSEEFFEELKAEVEAEIDLMKDRIENVENSVENVENSVNTLTKNTKFKKSDFLNWSLKFRTLVSTGRNFNYSGYVPDPDGYYTQAQGATVVNKNGTNYYCICSTMERYNIAGTVNAYSNNIKLRKYIDGNMQSIQALILNNFGHANGMTYNPLDDCLYIVSGAHYSDQTLVFDFKVAKVNFTTFELVEIKDFENAEGLPTGIDHFTSVNFYNDNIYLNSRKYCCKLINWNNPAVELVYTASDEVLSDYIGTTAQVSFFAGDYVLWLTHAPSNLYLCDSSNGKLIFKYNIPESLKGWHLGEVEDIDFNSETGEFFICHTFNTCSSDYAQLRHNGFIYGNLYTNKTNDSYNAFLSSPARLDVVNVNQVFTLQGGTTTCPDGSSTAPFYCTQEAFNYCNDNPDYDMIDIKLNSNDSRMLYGIAKKPFYINGAIPNVENSGGQPTTCYRLGGAIVRGNGGFTSITVVAYNTLQLSQHHATLKFLHGNFSCVNVFTACWLGCSTLASSAADDWFTHGISLTSAFLNYAGGYTQSQVEAQSVDEISYTLITRALNTNSTANMHGQATVSGVIIM